MEELVKEGFTIKDACFGSGISQSRYCELSSKKPGGNYVHSGGGHYSDVILELSKTLANGDECCHGIFIRQ